MFSGDSHERHANRFVKHTLNKSFPTETRLLTYRGRQYTTRIQASDNTDNKVVPFARTEHDNVNQQAA